VAHGPRCAAAARVNRRRTQHHTNLIPLYLLAEVFVVEARQLGGGGRGERAGRGEKAAR
jgi:hypothetical protein